MSSIKPALVESAVFGRSPTPPTPPPSDSDWRDPDPEEPAEVEPPAAVDAKFRDAFEKTKDRISNCQ
jgi:hypothetical protein